MVANDDLEGKTTHFTGFYTHTISGPNIPKPPIVSTELHFSEVYFFEIAVAIASLCLTLWNGFKIFGSEIVWV